MPEQVPRLSIGLPVYNGERFLRQTLDSLLAQTFTDYELIISDNGSTDATETICREYAARDHRIRYFRAEVNRGITWNMNRCVELSRGGYFKWAAADDLCEPQFLEKCIEVLDRDPSVVVCYPAAKVIDEQGRFLYDFEYTVPGDAPAVHTRYRALTSLDYRRHCCLEIFGVIRMAALKRTTLLEGYARADNVLLVRLAMLGRFHHLPERLFLNRDHSSRSIRLPPGRYGRLARSIRRLVTGGPIPPTEWWDPSKKGRIVFPEWRLVREYARSVRLAPLSAGARAMCYLNLGYFLLWHWPKLIRDIIIALRKLTGSRRHRPLADARPASDAGELVGSR